jgi:hypothetical protein
MSSESGCLLGGAIGILIVTVFFDWLFDAQWFYKAFYVMYDSVSWNHVDIWKKPHDCEFSKAPLGDKNCHFERVTHKVEWATNASGQPIRSFDSGKTWEVHTPGKCGFEVTLDCPNVYDPPNNVAPKYITVTGVMITWMKVQD